MNKKIVLSLIGVVVVIAVASGIFYEKFFMAQPTVEAVDDANSSGDAGQTPENFGDEIAREKPTPPSPQNLKIVISKLKTCFQLDDKTEMTVGPDSQIQKWKPILQSFLGTEQKEDQVADELQLQYVNGSNATFQVLQNVVHGLRIESELASFTCDSFDDASNCVCE